MNTSTCLLAAALFTALAPQSEAQSTPSRAKSTSLEGGVFAWPVPGKVIVTETTRKQGRTVKMRYSLTIRRERDTKDKGAVRISYGDFAFLEVNGRDVTSPRWKRALAPSLAATSAIPDLLIRRNGEFDRVTGIDAMIERVDKIIAGIRKESPAQAQQRRAAFERPQFRTMLQASISGYWDAWVEKWIDWKVPVGKSVDDSIEMPIAGTKLRGKGKWTHHGAVRGKPGFVRLSFSSSAKGPELIAALQGLVTSLGAAPLGQMKNEAAPTDGKMETHIEAITRLDTLRPYKITTLKTVQIRESGSKKAKGSSERHEYVFDWQSPPRK